MRANKFASQCNECCKLVPAGEGRLERCVGGFAWIVLHKTRADCDAAKPMPSSGFSRRRAGSGDWDSDPGYSDLGIETFQG